ncbi:hypothetical protein ACH5RR_037855 [Cinchona calisaya]|uniref:Uncharacterized protein n=1 Tax=Cinchona calisaya TaxID=153742 RepID=A0ABD2Y7D9_9GENT
MRLHDKFRRIPTLMLSYINENRQHDHRVIWLDSNRFQCFFNGINNVGGQDNRDFAILRVIENWYVNNGRRIPPRADSQELFDLVQSEGNIVIQSQELLEKRILILEVNFNVITNRINSGFHVISQLPFVTRFVCCQKEFGVIITDE